MGDRGRASEIGTPTTKKKRIRSKSTKRVKLSAMQERVKDVVTFLQPHQEAIMEAKTIPVR